MKKNSPKFEFNFVQKCTYIFCKISLIFFCRKTYKLDYWPDHLTSLPKLSPEQNDLSIFFTFLKANENELKNETKYTFSLIFCVVVSMVLAFSSLLAIDCFFFIICIIKFMVICNLIYLINSK